MVPERRKEALAKLMVGGRLPTEHIVLERLMSEARELTQDVVVFTLTRTDLVENNLVSGASRKAYPRHCVRGFH